MAQGDRNTGFFPRMANSHMRRNHLTKLRIDGIWATEESILKQKIVSAFKTLLIDPGDWRASIDDLSFSRINDEEAARLEMPSLEEEVHSILCEMNGDKALGLDGFTTAFWQFC